MAKYLTDEAVEFRRLVVALEGNQEAIGAHLGISNSAVSHRLRSKLHRSWWRSFKKRRQKRLRAARQARWRRKASARYRSGEP